MKRVALVTGANRGIGFEVCRELARQGFRVILTARSSRLGKAAAAKLAREGHDVRFHPLDVSRHASIATAVRQITRRHGPIAVLVNNAGICPGGRDGSDSPQTLRKAFDVNSIGPLLLCEAVLPGMKRKGFGRIVNVSSSMGQLEKMKPGWAGYRMSKAALNAVTRMVSRLGEGHGILVNSICPGSVRTRMTGPFGERAPEEAALDIVRLALLPEGGPTGEFFIRRKKVRW